MKKATEDVSETNSEERIEGSGTKTKQMRTSAEKASTKAANKGEIKGKPSYLHTYVSILKY